MKKLKHHQIKYLCATLIIGSRCLNSGSPPTTNLGVLHIVFSITCPRACKEQEEPREIPLVLPFITMNNVWLLSNSFLSPWDGAHLFLHLKSQWQIFPFRLPGPKAKCSSAERTALPYRSQQLRWISCQWMPWSFCYRTPQIHHSSISLEIAWSASQSPSSQGVLSLESGSEIINKRDFSEIPLFGLKGVSLHSWSRDLGCFLMKFPLVWLTKTLVSSKNSEADARQI